MNQQEFETRIKSAVSPEDFEIVQEVYIFHPSIPDVGGKDVIAKIWKQFGMRMIRDMLDTAQRMSGIESDINHEKIELDNLQRQIRERRECIKIMEERREAFTDGTA